MASPLGRRTYKSQRHRLSRIVLTHAPRQPASWLIFDVGQRKMRAVVPLLPLIALSGCATTKVAVSGVCHDKTGAPLSGVVVKEMDVRGSILGLFFAVLPEIKEHARAVSGTDGRFSLAVETRHEWLLQIEDPAPIGPWGGSIRVTVPEHLTRLGKAFYAVTIDRGFILLDREAEAEERKEPNQPPEPTR